MKKVGITVAFLFLLGYAAKGQAEFEELGTNLWIGSYNKFRIADKWIWDAQHHYRRAGNDNLPFAGQMAQIYNRHALTYLLNDRVNITAGGVLRLDWNPNPGAEGTELVILEPRFWHEYLFIMPFGRLMIYHRIRIEHRWSTRHAIDSDWIYRDRWRYKFYANYPINKPRLGPGVWYATPDVEIIMQSGSPVGDAPLEDLRIYPQLGYIVSPRLKLGGGPMYTLGQRLGNGIEYRHRWVIRLNAYVSLDFRKDKAKIPEIKIRD